MSVELVVDHVIAGSGYDIDVERLEFIHPKLRCAIERLERAPKLNATFETSVSGLHFIGPASAMSFGPLFRFVVGAEYTARVVSAHLAARAGFPLTKQWSLAALMDETGHRIAFVRGYFLWSLMDNFEGWMDMKNASNSTGSTSIPSAATEAFCLILSRDYRTKRKWFDRNGTHSSAWTVGAQPKAGLKRAQ